MQSYFSIIKHTTGRVRREGTRSSAWPDSRQAKLQCECRCTVVNGWLHAQA